MIDLLVRVAAVIASLEKVNLFYDGGVICRRKFLVLR